MRKLILMLAIALTASLAGAKEIKEYKVTTNPHMTCQNCENKIKGTLRFEKGVKDIKTDLEHQVVTVTYDADQTTEAKINEAFAKLKYDVKKVDGAVTSAAKSHCGHCAGAKQSCGDKKTCDGKKSCAGKKSCDGKKKK